jgi:hypothetical protein
LKQLLAGNIVLLLVELGVPQHIRKIFNRRDSTGHKQPQQLLVIVTGDNKFADSGMAFGKVRFARPQRRLHQLEPFVRAQFAAGRGCGNFCAKPIAPVNVKTEVRLIPAGEKMAFQLADLIELLKDGINFPLQNSVHCRSLPEKYRLFLRAAPQQISTLPFFTAFYMPRG